MFLLDLSKYFFVILCDDDGSGVANIYSDMFRAMTDLKTLRVRSKQSLTVHNLGN